LIKSNRIHGQWLSLFLLVGMIIVLSMFIIIILYQHASGWSIPVEPRNERKNATNKERGNLERKMGAASLSNFDFCLFFFLLVGFMPMRVFWQFCLYFLSNKLDRGQWRRICEGTLRDGMYAYVVSYCTFL